MGPHAETVDETVGAEMVYEAPAEPKKLQETFGEPSDLAEVAAAMLLVIFGACAISVAPLVLPLSHVDGPLLDSWAYWFVYNAWVAALLLTAAFCRHNQFLRAAFPDALAEVLSSNGEQACLLIGSVFTMLGFFLSAWLLGPSRIASSYIMLWVVPLATSPPENLYLLIFGISRLPSASRVRAGIVSLVFGLGPYAPIYLILIGIVAGSVNSDKGEYVKALTAFGLVFLRAGYCFGYRYVGDKLAARFAKLESRLYQTDALLAVQALFGMSDLALMPGGNPEMVLMASCAGLMATTLLWHVGFRRELQRLQTLSAESSAGVSRESRACGKTTGAAIDDLVDFHPGLRQLAASGKRMCRLKTSLIGLSARHIILVIQPLTFLCAYFALMNGGKREHYYLYECLNPANQAAVYQATALRFVFGVVCIAVDFALLRNVGFGSCLWELHVAKLTRSTKWCTMGPSAFACLLFTSCYLIKHDGLEILHKLSETQEPCFRMGE